MGRRERLLGGLVALDLSREIVEGFECPHCHDERAIRKPIELVKPEWVACVRCGKESTPRFCHSLTATSALLELTPRQLGLPSWDIVWARNAESALGLELALDQPAEMEA